MKLRTRAWLRRLSIPGLVLFAFGVGWANWPASVQTPQSRETLNAQDAARAIEDGKAAGLWEDWPRAIERFDAARHLLPFAPEPLLLLGAAEAKVPGRELRAICWLEAWLALVPQSADAEHVRRNVIPELDEMNRQRLKNELDFLDGIAKSMGWEYYKHNEDEDLRSLREWLAQIPLLPTPPGSPPRSPAAARWFADWWIYLADKQLSVMAFTKSDLDDSVSRGAGFHQYYSGVSLPDFSFHGIDPGLFTGNQPTDAQKQGASRFDGVKEIARVTMSGLYGVRGRQMAAAELGPLLATEKVKSIIGTWGCVGEFHEGLAAVHDLGHPDCEGYGWSFINRQGVMVIPPEAVYATGRSDFIREAPRFSEGLAGLPGRFINRDGQVAIKGDWGSCHGNFHEGLAAVGRSDDHHNCTSWGFINTDGKMVIAYGSDNGSSSGYYVSNIGPELAFSDGLAAVRPEPVTHRAESGEWVLGG